MLIQNIQIFDRIISGTATTWYSPAFLNADLGAADVFAVQATTTLVAGTSPTLTVQSQHSSDDQNWMATPSAEISTSMSEGGAYVGRKTVLDLVLLANIRFAISLGGTDPKCRLRIYFAGRAYAGRPDLTREQPRGGLSGIPAPRGTGP